MFDLDIKDLNESLKGQDVTPRKKTAFFSICSNNYMAYAQTLFNSIRVYHPEFDRFLCVVDDKLDLPGFYPPDSEILFAHELGIPDFDSFAFQYDIMELNTAVKPFVIQKLFDARYDHVIYLDPDIEVFRRLDSVVDALDRGSSFVMTPHLCTPAENDAEPGDRAIMRAGVYNLGFLASSNQRETFPVLRWWSRRLRFECRDEQDRGTFVDQKFMDLVPGFTDHTHILRDTTLNVAYWNLKQRRLTKDGQSWFVDGRPLSFFHFSGIEPGNLAMLSKHTSHFRGENIDLPLRSLMQRYFKKLTQFGHGSVPAGTYAYGKFASGTPIHPYVRRMYRDHYLPWSGNPFDTFEEFIHLSHVDSLGSSEFVVTNFMKYLWDIFPWLQSNFNLRIAAQVEAFARWYVESACSAARLDPRMVEPVAVRAGRRPPAASVTRSYIDQTRPDVTVVAYLKMAGGVGEVGRRTLRSLVGTDLLVQGRNIDLGVLASGDDSISNSLLSQSVAGKVQIYNINADQLPIVIDHIQSQTRTDAYRIAIPFWELAEFPDAWLSAFDKIDEIWAPSKFIQMALFRKLAKPILHVPVALSFEATKQFDRAYFSLPEDKFLFFVSFDFLSYQERKNPKAAYTAFRRAFRQETNVSDVALVVKSLNGEFADDQLLRLREEFQEDPGVLLIDDKLTRPQILDLIGVCDCVVSLHRSEGLGLVVAEAMALGKPVVATDYSATTELVGPSTGFPVDYRLIPVEQGQYPFANGKWADPDVQHAAWLMRRIYSNPDAARQKTKQAKAHLELNYGEARVAGLQLERLREIGLTPRSERVSRGLVSQR